MTVGCRPAFAVALVLAVIALGGCGETATSYCRGLYRDGARTPAWAHGQFDDMGGCVDWYRAGKPPAGER